MVSTTELAVSLSVCMACLLAGFVGFVSPVAGLGSSMSVSMAIVPIVFLMLYLSGPKYGPNNVPDTKSVGPPPEYDVIDGLTINGIRPDSSTEGGLPPVPTPCETIDKDCHANPFCTHWEEWSMTPTMTKAWLPGQGHKDRVCVQKFGPFIPDECSGKYHTKTDRTGNVWENGKLVTSQTRDLPGYIPKLCNSLDSSRTTVHVHPRLYALSAKSGYPVDKTTLLAYQKAIVDRYKCTGWCKFSEIMKWIDIALMFVMVPFEVVSSGLTAASKAALTQRYGAEFAAKSAATAKRFGRVKNTADAALVAGAGVEIGGMVIDAKSTAATWRNFGQKIPISNLETPDYQEVANRRTTSCTAYKKYQQVASKPFSAFNHATYGDGTVGTVRGPINIEYGPNPCATGSGVVSD